MMSIKFKSIWALFNTFLYHLKGLSVTYISIFYSGTKL